MQNNWMNRGNNMTIASQ